ncbi:hypothetical protein [Pseudoxanthomonas sp.]|uniref:hypothetical protein n=1 Tax=Pseudoxanthomonas sp. TaxID=1871049 RepID=UPI0025F67C52|nr:hypothetical protein [Pseudoxanthomonas sp.]
MNLTVVILAALVVYALLDLHRSKRRIKQLEQKVNRSVSVEVGPLVQGHERRLQTLETSDRKRTLTELMR